MNTAPYARRFLFLQGPIGPFAAQIGAALMDAGHTVHRINFNGGDKISWPLLGAVDYLGCSDDWAAFLAKHLAQWRIGEIVLFGDCRPLHRVAIEQARQLGITVHVLEEGYLRPGWLTMETGGVNGHSNLSRDAGWYRRAARNIPTVSTVPRSNGDFARRALHDVLYNLGNAIWSWRFKAYRTHKPWSAAVEYRAGFRRFFRIPQLKRQARQTAEAVIASGQPYYVFPLQLDSDSQVRCHSSFGCMAKAIDSVVASFALHAPSDATLAITEHPLDQGVTALHAAVESAAAIHGVSSRVRFLPMGTPAGLLEASQGVVTVNSTLGLSALRSGVGVVVLGKAIYALPGMTHQGGLDTFWREPERPDATLIDAFLRVIAERTQLAGNPFSAQGRHIARRAMLERLLGPQVIEKAVYMLPKRELLPG